VPLVQRIETGCHGGGFLILRAHAIDREGDRQTENAKG
jgi:hypothetical protein